MSYTLNHRWLVLAADLVVGLLAYGVAVWTHNRYVAADVTGLMSSLLGVIYLVSLGYSFYRAKTYLCLTRHLQVNELVRLVLLLLPAALLVYLLLLISHAGVRASLLLAFQVYGLTLMGLVLLRFLIVRLYYSFHGIRDRMYRVVYGRAIIAVVERLVGNETQRLVDWGSAHAISRGVALRVFVVIPGSSCCRKTIVLD
jgi:FlaA1/EpsC-like NDP-sugar epimerase